jgi:hypothetical protein
MQCQGTLNNEKENNLKHRIERNGRASSGEVFISVILLWPFLSAE